MRICIYKYIVRMQQFMFALSGLYHVQDQSGLRSVEQARGGKCPPWTFHCT